MTVNFFGDHTDLHWVWDSTLIDRAYPNPEALRDHVAASVAASDRQQWERGGPEGWAEESHRAAVDVAYALPPDGELDDAYLARALPALREQLGKAAVRLAGVLNTALGPH